METIKIFHEDLQIAKALIKRDEFITRQFFYRQCYPLFKSIYDSFYTDCTCCKEFIDEIYLLTLSPSRLTGKCAMENFRGESTLTSWLKIVGLTYCKNKFNLKQRLPIYEPLPPSSEKEDDEGVGKEKLFPSIEIDFSSLNRQDALAILNQMPNKRYSNLIKLRYLEQRTNEETAEILGMSMDNYYNKHKLAKEQYTSVLRKEAQYGR